MGDEVADLLVVGLGPGGGSAALAAARAGLRVVAVERRRRVGEPVQCAELVPRALAGRVRDAVVQPVTDMRTMLPSGVQERRPFPGLMIDRARLDAGLAAAAGRAGARVLTATRLVGLDLRRWVAVLRDGAGERALGFRLLIAADGPHSGVAALLGLPRLATVRARQYSLPLQRPYHDTDIWLADAYPGGYAWLFPWGERAHLGVGVDPRYGSGPKRALETLLAEQVAAGRVHGRVLTRTGGAIPVGGPRPSLVLGPVLLVGDAAGLTHPISGAGIAAALESGELAGRAAAAHLAGDGGALGDYEEEIGERFGPALTRAAARRRELEGVWRTPAARRDGPLRRGWIAFDEYYTD